MSRSPSDEIVQGYIEEVRTYIPSLRQGIDILKKRPDQKDALEETHRLVHTIKGASAMVGIYGLSHIACQMEDTLDDIIAGKLAFSDDAFQIMSRTVGHFQTYCTDFLEKGVHARAMLEETVPAFRRIRGFPPEEDAETLGKLLEIVPEYEGGNTEPGMAETPDPPEENHGQQAGDSPMSRVGISGENDEELMSLLDAVPESADDEQDIRPESGPQDHDDLMALLDAVPEPAGDEQDFGPESVPQNHEDLMALLDAVPEPAGDEQNFGPESVPQNHEDLMALLDAVPELTDDEQNFGPESDSQDHEALMVLLDTVPGPEAVGDIEDTTDAAGESASPGSSLPPELLESFYEEAEEHLQELGRSVNILESQITGPVVMSPTQKEIIRQIRRSVHTLKGASAMMGLPNISTFAHSAEDLLDWLYEKNQNINPDIVSVLTESADLLERIVAQPQDPQTPKADALREQYRKIMEGASPEPNREAGDIRLTPESLPSDLPPELLESFYEEAEEHLQDMGRSLNTLESQITEPVIMSPAHKEIVRQIRRSVHTLKGASAVIGLPNISTFAHSAEDLLDWLYEKTEKITPDIVSVLTDSADLLERIVGQPQNPQTSRADALTAQYRKIMGGDQPDMAAIRQSQRTADSRQEITGYATPPVSGTVEELPRQTEDVSKEDIFADLPSYQAKTIRVGMDRIDELVNLVGELIIASSAFDQKMDTFLNAVKELDLSRDRLRDVARDMEVGYEVKALEGLWAPSSGNNGQRTSTGSRHRPMPGEQSAAFEDFDTLELDRYSELNLIIRTLNESVIDVGTINTHLSNFYSDFDGHITRQRVLLSELQDKVMRVRMTPMSSITNKLRRTVREIAAKLGKKIRLIIEGEDIELDRVIWEKITDPMMHILRNATDHGIEPPELRQALEKPPVATIKLAAIREGNQVILRVTDDGAGLNYQAIRATALEAGLIDKSDEMSEDDLASLIFKPGFSTRGKISEVSGRGVGMDVVKQNIQELKGSVRLASWKDQGTRFTIRIPLTLAVMRGLLFTVSEQTFAIALNEIKEILRIDQADITNQIEEVVRIGDEILPLYYLAKVLNIRKDEGKYRGARDDLVPAPVYPLVLVVESGGRRGAMVIDTLTGQREIVIKSTGSHLRYVKGISGVTIMGDGSVVPILNVEELFRYEDSVSEAIGSGQEPLTTENPLEIMVVDDSVSIRQVVTRLMEEQGWKTHTAKDGIDALEKLRDFRPDIIVLDIEMPRMNGYEFLSAIRAEPAYKKIPVVMLTSRTTAKHRDRAISLGVRGFIVKPYNNDEFVDLVLKLTSD